MNNNLKLTHKGLVLVSVPLLFQIIFLVSLSYFLIRAEDEARKTDKSRTLIAEAGHVAVYFYNAGVSLALYKMVGSDDALQTYESLVKKIQKQVDVIGLLTKDEPDEKSLFEDMQTTATQGIKMLSDVKDGKSIDSPNTSLLKTLSLSHRLVKILDQISFTEERHQFFEPKAEAHFKTIVKNCLVGGFIFNIILAVLLAIFFNVGTIKRLSVVLQNLERFGKGEKLLPPLTGNDEIETLDAAFRKMASALVEAKRREREIMDMVSHDLRSPLTSMQFSLDILGSGGRGPISEAGLNDIAIAKKNIKQLMGLINYLLESEKLSSGTVSLNLEQISVNSLIDRSVESIRSWALDRDVTINYSKSDLSVEGDFERLVQVVINLLSNAIKFSPEHGNVDILALLEDSRLVIKIIDQGPGIAKEQQTELFQRFHQLNNISSKDYSGSGLGLSICQKIVELHHGAIGVESEEGKGCTFWFSIPVAQ